MNNPIAEMKDNQTLGEKTPTGSKFGFTLFGTNGEKVTIDSPEKLEAMIKEAPEMAFDVIVMLASKCYDQEEMLAALSERLQMLTTKPADDDAEVPRPMFRRLS